MAVARRRMTSTTTSTRTPRRWRTRTFPTDRRTPPMNTIQIEVQAIRVLEDLIAERGQWLIVYPSGRIEVLNGEQVEHRAPAPEPAPADRNIIPYRYIVTDKGMEVALQQNGLLTSVRAGATEVHP